MWRYAAGGAGGGVLDCNPTTHLIFKQALSKEDSSNNRAKYNHDKI